MRRRPGVAGPLALALLALGCPLPRPAPRPAPAPVDDARAWAQGALVYEIFVRSFADGDGDGVGDLRGLRQALDALDDGRPGGDDLEVDALWLMPIFEASSDHGYDVTDYRRVAPALGTADDLAALLEAAHGRGLRVVLDLVLNHTGEQHPWFREAAASTTSARRDWYLWRDRDPGWVQPWSANPTWHRRRSGWYHGLFSPGMPDLNLANPEVERELLEVATFWLQQGVDGFRLDGARHLFASGSGDGQSDQPATLRWWQRFARQVHDRFPQAVLLGEVWADAPTIGRYLRPAEDAADSLDGAFDFALAEAIERAVSSGDARALRQAVDASRVAFGPRVDATFVGNHDLPRLARRLGAEPARLVQAHAILLSLPGTPVLYAGDELGQLGSGASGDLAQRTPYPWGAGDVVTPTWTAVGELVDGRDRGQQLRDPSSVVRQVQAWTRARRALPALRHGSLRWLDGGDGVLLFVREHAQGSVLVAHNLTDAPARCALAPALRPQLLPRLGTVGEGDVDGTPSLALAPRSSLLIALQR